jgi:hypothetical protein
MDHQFKNARLTKGQNAEAEDGQTNIRLDKPENWRDWSAKRSSPSPQ